METESRADQRRSERASTQASSPHEVNAVRDEKGDPSNLASFGQRAGAQLIDHLIILGVWIIPLIIIWNILLETSDQAEADYNDIVDIALPILGVMWILYFWIGNSVGATIGKRRLGLRTVSNVDRESKIGLAKGLFRAIVQAVGGYLLFVGWLLCLFGSQKQALHDRVVGSAVVIKRSP